MKLPRYLSKLKGDKYKARPCVTTKVWRYAVGKEPAKKDLQPQFPL